MEKCTSQKQAGRSILMPNQVDLRAKNINIETEGLLCGKKVMNSSRGHNNPKCLCP